MDLLTTLPGSLMEHFFPAGWDLKKIDACVDDDPKSITTRQKFWHPKFQPVPCDSIHDFDTLSATRSPSRSSRAATPARSWP